MRACRRVFGIAQKEVSCERRHVQGDRSGGDIQREHQQAVRNGIARASQALRNLDWFEVTEIRGHIVNGKVGHFQVTMKIGFKLEG